MKITKNGVESGSGFAKNGGGSVAAIVNLRPGDKIRVQRMESRPRSVVIEPNFSRFLGYKIGHSK